MRAIDRALREAEFRDRFEIEQQWAVRIGDLQEALLRHRPDIVHFSGHGTESSEIVLEGDSGTGQAVPQDALSRAVLRAPRQHPLRRAQRLLLRAAGPGDRRATSTASSG